MIIDIKWIEYIDINIPNYYQNSNLDKTPLTVFGQLLKPFRKI